MLLAVAALAATGCTRAEQDRDKVLAAIDRTEQLARTFSYSESAAGHRAAVTGAIADDFRYQAALTRDGAAAAAEVVYDDSRALQVQDQALLAGLVDTSRPVALPVGSTVAAAVDQSPALAALKQGRWTVDAHGAASLALRTLPRDPGAQPFDDALTYLEYVRRAIAEARSQQPVVLFNPESENYRPKLDPFPRPAAGELRYDVVPPDLPARSRVGTGQNIGVQNQVPGLPFFRLMAVYVQDGLVKEVREQVSVETRLADPQSNLEARLGDFVSVKPGASLSVQAQALTAAINRELARTLQPLIRPRSIDLKLGRLGQRLAVSLPAGAVPVDLSNLTGDGVLLYESH